MLQADRVREKGDIGWLIDRLCNRRVVSPVDGQWRENKDPLQNFWGWGGYVGSLPFYHPSNLSLRQFSPFLSQPDSLHNIPRSMVCLINQIYLWFKSVPMTNQRPDPS